MGEEVSEGNMGEEQRSGKAYGHHAAYILYTQLTWPNHQIWNATDFSFSQKEDLMEAMAWSHRQKKVKK